MWVKGLYMGWVQRTCFWFVSFGNNCINIHCSFPPLCSDTYLSSCNLTDISVTTDISSCYIPVWIEGAWSCNINLNSESPWNGWSTSWLKEPWATWIFYTWSLPHQIIIVPLRTYQSELNQFSRVTVKCMNTFIHFRHLYVLEDSSKMVFRVSVLESSDYRLICESLKSHLTSSHRFPLLWNWR